jgi:hypothetical protein
MIEISPLKVAPGPRELDFGLRGWTEKREKAQLSLVNAWPKGIIRFPKGTKWVGNTNLDS